MKQITIRNLPPEVEKAIRSESRSKHLSLNKTIVEMLKRAAGVAQPATEPFRYHDLDDLAGGWTIAEADEFDGYLAEQRQIDEELWK